MPDFTKPKELQAAVIDALGERSGSEATKAVAYWKPTESFWAVKQGGNLKDEEIAALKESLGTQEVFQAWPNKGKTSCATNTGFHAEMVIVSAHILWQGRDENRIVSCQSIDWKKLTVAANCGCCIHCQLAMKELKINFLESDYGESNTAWWSPLTDRQIAKDDPQFSKGTSLLLAEKMLTYK